MSLQTIVYDYICARVTDAVTGTPIPLLSVEWEAGYLVLRAVHGDGLTEHFKIARGGAFVICLSHPELGERSYTVEYQDSIVFPCELPGGEAAVREVVALCNVKWKERHPNAR